MFSIIMPVFNSEKYLSQAILSVLNQTFTDFELILVDDFSGDNSAEICKRYSSSDDRVKYFSNTFNMGVAATRNFGIEKAAGDYIAFLDSDDLWYPDFLLMYAKSFAETGASILHSSYFTIDECSNIIGYVQSPPVINFSGNLLANRIGNLTGVYSRDVFGKVLQKNIRHEDYNMWLDLLSFHNSVRVEPALSAYRITRNSLSSNKIASVMWHFKVIFRGLSCLGGKK